MPPKRSPPSQGKNGAISAPDADSSTSSVVPQQLQGRNLPHIKLFCIFTALEERGQLGQSLWKRAAQLSKGDFTEAALETNLRDWRKHAKEYLKQVGVEVPETPKKGKPGPKKRKAEAADEGGVDADDDQTETPTSKKRKIASKKQKGTSAIKMEDKDDDGVSKQGLKSPRDTRPANSPTAGVSNDIEAW